MIGGRIDALGCLSTQHIPDPDLLRALYANVKIPNILFTVFMKTSDIQPLNESADCLRRRFILAGGSLIGILFLLLGSVTLIHGYTMLEKTLTELVSPLGLAWMLLFLLIFLCYLRRQRSLAFLALVCWLLLTLGGNSFFANWMLSKLEAPYSPIDPFESGHFDLVVVLGGGTSYHAGHSQFSTGGDRVGLAARLYHAGQCDRIICTGSSTYRATEKEPHAREQSAELLKGLLVPADRIILIAGDNTSQEMQSLALYLQDKGLTSGRYGLITSAAHLPRAMRLANKNGLTLIALPADVRGRSYRPNPNEIVPGAESLATTKMVIKEYLGNLLGR